MATTLLMIIQRIRTSLWFIPAVMAMAAAVLAMLLLWIDAETGAKLPGPLQWLKARDAETIRTLLATTVGSIVTIISVVFSITIVVLTLAASQLGPRLLGNFMRDRGTQRSLGVFVATFIYCIIVLQTAGLFDDEHTLPHIATFAALMLTIISLFVLIYFVHHIATMIQAPSIIDRVSRELHRTIERMFPEQAGEDAADDFAPDRAAAMTLTADREGYLQAIDIAGLLAIAAQQDVMIDLRCRPGQYIIPDAPLADIHGRPLDGDTCNLLRRRIVIGAHRTDTQDVRFGVRELVEIAVRALSPGINDPITAMNCVDHIGGALARIGSRNDPPSLRRDEAGVVRLRLRTIGFEDVADVAINQVRQHARNDVAVTIRLLEMLAQIAGHIRLAPRREVLLRQASIIRLAADDVPDASDRADIAKAYDDAAAALSAD